MSDDEREWIPEEPIKHYASPSQHTKRLEGFAKVRAGRRVGKRGGVREPIAIEWRTVGTGLFRLVERGTGKAVLAPWVKYRNGNGAVRSCDGEAWHQWESSLVPREVAA